MGTSSRNGPLHKLSKITEVLNVPDSVKSSHILVPFVGGMRADASVTKTEEQAKKTADSIYALVKNNSAKFKAIADEIESAELQAQLAEDRSALNTFLKKYLLLEQNYQGLLVIVNKAS